MRKGKRVWLVLGGVWLAIMACRLASGGGPVLTPDAAVEPEPDTDATPVATLLPTPTQWPTPVNQTWRAIAQGVERSEVAVHAPYFRFPATVQLIRVDPSIVKIHTHYSPAIPITVEQWQRETRAMVVVNGGFFNAAKRLDGLMVSFGYKYGESFAEGGMFTLEQGAAGVRDLEEQPYGRSEEFDEAMQAYPMLVNDGLAVHPGEDGRYNRRTAIGVDGAGRVIFIVIDEPTVSLFELSQWLAASDLDLVGALNLDGGGSTGLAIETELESTLIEADGPLPVVIAVYP